MPYFIIHHDCEFHSEDCAIVGPFDTVEEAGGYFQRHQLDVPGDGGYAFGIIVGPDAGLSASVAPEDYCNEDEDEVVA